VDGLLHSPRAPLQEIPPRAPLGGLRCRLGHNLSQVPSAAGWAATHPRFPSPNSRQPQTPSAPPQLGTGSNGDDKGFLLGRRRRTKRRERDRKRAAGEGDAGRSAGGGGTELGWAAAARPGGDTGLGKEVWWGFP